MKKYIILFAVVAVILLGMSFLYHYEAPQPEYSEEQLDALSRIDPLHILTDNSDAFYSRDTLMEAVENGRFDSTVKPDIANGVVGSLDLPFYGISKPVRLNYLTRGGRIITAYYGFSLLRELT